MSQNDSQVPAGPGIPVKGEATPSAVERPPERKPRARTAPPETLGQFIRQAYARSGKKLSLSAALEKNLDRSPALSEQERAHLLSLSRSDGRLSVALELLLAVRKFATRPQLRNALRDFVGQVLQSHPVFAGRPDLLDAMANRPGSLDPERALQQLAASRQADLVPAGASPRVGARALDDLRRNAMYAFLLWIAETRGMSSEAIVRCLYATLWGPAGAKARTDADQLRQLIGKPSVKTVGAVAAVYRAAAQEQVRTADLAREVALKAEERATKLLEELNVLSRENARLVREHEVMTGELGDARRQIETERFHARDDYERLRGRLFQRLRQEVKLLEDGLHALRRTPPKVDVMDDHAERVLEGLKREIVQLDGESGK